VMVIHWKGDAHTQLAIERPRSATETATPMEALEIIRRMAVRYGDDQNILPDYIVCFLFQRCLPHKIFNPPRKAT